MSESRRVRQLRLTGADPADILRARHLVEDAFRTASLPLGRPGSMVVVRRLDLGPIDLGKPSQSVALRLTEAVRNIVSGAVHVSHPHALAAPAVWFVDAPEARALLAVRLVHGPPPREWFWRAALPEILDAPTAAHAVARLFEPPPPTTPGEPPTVVAVARILQVLVEHGAAEAVLARMPQAAAWGPEFRRAWGPAPRPLPVSLAPPASAPITPEWRPILRKAVEEWTASDVRTVWLATVAVVAARPERVASPETPRLALQAIALVAREVRQPPLLAPAPEVPARPLARGPVPPVAVAEAPASPPVGPPLPIEPAPPPVVAPDRPWPLSEPPVAEPARAEAARADLPASLPPRWLEPSEVEIGAARLGLPPPLDRPALTASGGLLYFVRALYLLGLWETVSGEPDLLDQAFGYRVLDGLLDRVGAEPDEPMRRAIAPSVAPHPLGDEDFVAPDRWWEELCPEPALFEHGGPGQVRLVRALSPGLWLARERTPDERLAGRLEGRTLALGPPVDAAAVRAARRDAWVSALARWSGMFLGAEPAEIVHREAIVAATRTHVDVVFPKRALDLRVRRRALDADPGWVPWLGRIVMFHYVEDEDFRLPEAAR